MTVNKLHEVLSDMVKEGCGRMSVCVDKPSLWDGNGTFQICDIKSADTVWVQQVDGDGFYLENRDGTERGRVRLVLSGEPKAKGRRR